MDILSDKIVTTRKKHICNGCLRSFEKGNRMRRVVNTFDGIGTWRECPTCQQLFKDHPTKFVNYEYIFYEGCVIEVLEKGQTPEQLLDILNNEKHSRQ